MRLAGALVIAFLAAGPAMAAAPQSPLEKQYTPAFQRCLDSPVGASTVGQIDCTQAELKVQDARLNAAYRKAQIDLNARQTVALTAAQRAWIAFRDTDCSAWQDEDWGSLSRVQASFCVLKRTIERTQQIKDYAGSH